MKSLIIESISFGADDLSEFHPEINDNFFVSFDVIISTKDGHMSSFYQATFCTVNWLTSELKNINSLFLSRVIVVDFFDAELIKDEIKSIVNKINSYELSTKESFRSLSKFLTWEFDDLI
ncbi:Imm8 family immunity protein [Corticibacter populi]|nr:Imm8 family immunity protein [Corticibacter populi]RZS35068.1 immunity protein 8 of polymorphic toxin system [Corticibacter populi]